MRAYKFLGAGAVGLYSGYRWPTGDVGEPGPWVEATGPLRECGNGIHACRTVDLPYWIDDELWEIELDGEVLVERRGLVARRGRLLHPVAGWTVETAAAFARACADRARELAAQARAVLDDRDGDLVARIDAYAGDVAAFAADAPHDVAWASCAAYAEAYLAGFAASRGRTPNPAQEPAFASARSEQAARLVGVLRLGEGDEPRL